MSAAQTTQANALFAAFQAAGAAPIEADILLPANMFLDLYGEDIRARAYITQDPQKGEMILRPDFTLPVALAHMSHGATPACYCYRGPVFRKQEQFHDRPSEYLQVGFELFDQDRPKADAEVFALFSALLSPMGAVAITGDIGILLAAIDGLTTSLYRKSALRRHIWRPKRFRALLDRFSGRAPKPDAALPPPAHSAPHIGLRGPDEIAARRALLAEEANVPPLNAPETAVLYDLIGLAAPCDNALHHLRGIEPLMPAIKPAVDRFETRLQALRDHGIDTAALAFEASHGRTTLEYYDGFVFSFHAPGNTLPAIASGGRYDALTAILGAGAAIPATGGIIRPALLAQLERLP